MANLKEVRNRISSVTSTQQITKAMKMVSAAKLKRATNAIVQLRPYAEKLRDILEDVSSSVEDLTSPYTKDRIPTRVLLILVSSNRGLAGAFNANVIKATNNLISSKYQSQFDKGNVEIVTVGKKMNDFFAKRDFNVVGNYSDIYSNISFEEVSKIAEYAMNKFKEGEIDRVEVIYNQFKNAAVQVLTTEQLLPLLPADDSETESQKNKSENNIDYIIEPSKDKIIEELIPKTIKIQLYKAILDSHASEHGARMTAMDKATDNAGDLLKKLKLSYNQARQAAITTELSEIVSGAAALSSS